MWSLVYGMLGGGEVAGGIFVLRSGGGCEVAFCCGLVGRPRRTTHVPQSVRLPLSLGVECCGVLALLTRILAACLFA